MSPKARFIMGRQQSEGRQMVDNIHAMVDAKIQVRIKPVPEIPRMAAGKYRWMVSETLSAPTRQSQPAGDAHTLATLPKVMSNPS